MLLLFCIEILLKMKFVKIFFFLFLHFNFFFLSGSRWKSFLGFFLQCQCCLSCSTIDHQQNRSSLSHQWCVFAKSRIFGAKTENPLGTVTRTSECRPELIFGTFVCVICGNPQVSVPQQHKYTEPTKVQKSFLLPFEISFFFLVSVGILFVKTPINGNWICKHLNLLIGRCKTNKFFFLAPKILIFW